MNTLQRYQQTVAFLDGNSTLAGASDTILRFYVNTISTAITDENPVVDAVLFTVSGDCSAFKGRYDIADGKSRKINNVTYFSRSHFKLDSATAFGDPTSEKADAVTLGTNAYLQVGAGVTQYATRGVAIAANKKGGVEAEAGDSWTLTAPVTCGSGAMFEKIGAGTVTLAGDCTGVGTIEVTEGTLVLSPYGTFADGLSVAVAAGATLVQNKYVGNITVTGAGTYAKDIQYIVPYNDSTGVSSPLDFTADMPELPLSVRLSEPVEIASFAANGWTAKRIEVARLPSDTAATAADFADATEKTYGLPNTRFEIEDGTGYKSLVLVAKPVVWSLRNISSSDGKSGTINGEPGDWSYGDEAQAGFDYLLTNALSRTGNNNDSVVPAFHGDSLTTAYRDVVTIQLTNPDINVGNLVCYAPQTAIRYVNSSVKGAGFTGITGGTIRVEDGAQLNLQTRKATNGTIMTNCIAVAISGNGTLKASFYETIEGGAPVFLTGDNSGFTGSLEVTSGSSSSTEADAITLHLGEATSLGGAMPAFTANGVRLRYYAFLMPEQTMTLNAENRGITVNAGGFDVPEGRVLTVAVPLTVAGTAIKRGAGELALGGALTYTSGSLAVKEGAVRILSDAAVANVPVTFYDGTSIVLDPEATTVNGFFGGTFEVAGEGTPKVNVSLNVGSPAFDADGQWTLPVCTVPASAADLADNFTLVRPRGFSAQLIKENVTISAANYVRYSVKYARRGFVLIYK